MIRFWGQQEPSNELDDFMKQYFAAHYVFETLLKQIAAIFGGKS